MNKIKNPVTRNKVAFDLFSRAGSKVVAMIGAGTDAIEKYRAEARQLGIMTRDDITKAEEFDSAYKSLNFTLISLRNTIGSKLMPMAVELATKLTKYLINRRPQIEAFARAFADRLPGALVAIRDGLVDVWDKLKPFGEYMLRITDAIGPANTILGGLAAVIGVQLVTAVGSFVAALTSLNALLVTTPAGWLIMAGAGFIGAVGATGLALNNYLSGLEETARANAILGDNPTITEADKADTKKMGRLLELYRKQAAAPGSYTRDDETEQTALESALNKYGLSGDFGTRFMALNDLYNKRQGAVSVPVQSAGKPVKQESTVTVEFKNAPENMNIGNIKGPVPLNIRMGFNLLR